MSAIPKWEHGTGDDGQGGSTQTILENWAECSKQWLYDHGRTVDSITGFLDWGLEISRAVERLVCA